MKSLLLITTLLFLIFGNNNLFGQDLIGLNIDGYAIQGGYPNYPRYLTKNLRALKKYNDPKKIYDRIDFTKDKDTMYTKGQCYYYNPSLKSSFIVKPHGPIYYSNGQVYANTDVNTRRYIDESMDIYHKNGKVMLHEYSHILSPDVNIIEAYDDTGRMIKNWYVESKYKQPKLSTYNNKKVILDNYARSFYIAPSANFPISKQLKSHYNGVYNQYEGYLTTGTYNMGDKYLFTGYFSPTMLSNGNGTVLFAEDLETKECWWVVVVDNTIEYTFPAEISEKPDVSNLNNIAKNYISMVQIEKPKIKGYRRAKKFLSLQNPFEFYSQENSYSFREFDKNILNTYSIATLNTPNFNSHNGYGISLTAQDSIIPGQIRHLIVGNIVNGKLNGIGYQCKLTYQIGDNTKWRYKDKILFLEIKVEASFGEFKDGVLISGRTINETHEKNKNIWDEISIPGLTYKSNYHTLGGYDNVMTDRVGLFSKILPGNKIFVDEVSRPFTVKSIDKEKKTIIIDSDINGKTTILDSNSGKIYLIIPSSVSDYVACSPTKQANTYETVPVVISSVKRSYIGLSVFIKDGVKYTYPKQPDIVTHKTVYETRVSGEKTVTCFSCNGTGKRSVSRRVESAYLIDFER